MTNRNSVFRFFVITLMLFSAQMLPAQWESLPAPGDENITNILNMGGIWVALGETGLYRSTNDGLSWSKTLDINTSYATAITQFGNDVFAIAYGQGLYRSSNQGMTWDLLSNQLPAGLVYPDGIGVTDNYILFETFSAVYRYNKAAPDTPVPVLNLGQLYYPNTLLMQVNGNEVWVAVKDSLLRSTDEGNTWNLVFEGHRAKGLAIHGDTIMLCTEAGLQRSVNNGATWSLVYSGSQTYGVFWQSGQWFFRAYPSNGNSFLYSSDGGNTWKTFSNMLDEAYATVFMLAKNGGTTMLATSVGIVRSTDGGNYWEVRNTGIGGEPSSFFDLGRLYELGNYLGLVGSASEDDGATWFRPLVDANNLGFPYTAHNGNFFATDYDQKLYRSVGDLRHWQAIGVQFTPGISHKLLSEGAHFYMFEYDSWNGSPATIYESTDNGLHWAPTGGTTSSALEIVAKGDYLFEWRGYIGLFRSQNGGVTWQSVGAGLSNLAQWSGDVKFHSDGVHLFAYDYNAIMVSSNNGLTFSKISNNLLNSFGYPMGADYLISDGNVVVVIADDGIYLSLGLNDQWFDISANLPFTYFYNESLIIHNGYILLDSENSGLPLWKRSLASINLAQFDGKVWRDDNNNGQQDPGEPPYKGAIVQAGSGSFATSVADGTYALFADLNNDTLRVKKPAPWVIPNPEFYNVTTTETGKNFGLYFPPDITDLQVDLTNVTVFRPGFHENIYLSYANLGTADSDGMIYFVANAPLEFQSAFPAPDGAIGDTLFWNLQNLDAFSNGQIVINVKVPVGTPISSLVTAYARINPTQPDANLADNQSFLSEIVFGSYDPNDKRCNALIITPEQIAAGEDLTYTIRFQNTGTYPAEFVRIADTLDFERLDVATFQVLATSHPCQTTLRGSGAVEFFFDQIDLPPSDFNEPASHGFIKYSIRPKAGLALGQQIRNTAFIYFDFNAPIVTNTTVTGVAETVGTQNYWQSNRIQALLLSPNPGTGIVQVQTGEKSPGFLRVFNALGALVLERNDFSDLEKLDLTSLPSGHYMLEWRSKTGWRKMGKWVKVNR
ncbi:MAG: T9SS type A sorting domain-containing protein [Saprospiraceae bacterium]|nr:T9SS type A sorting domain-containing protein [Saprospiraceae bacterium]